MTEFFADTFAILAYLQGDSAYLKRFRGQRPKTGRWNLYETYAVQRSRGVGAAEASANLAPFEPLVLEADTETLREAAELRLQLRSEGRRCSYVDAAGYALARAHGLPFVTGDVVFKDVEGVEFLPEAGTRPPRQRRGRG